KPIAGGVLGYDPYAEAPPGIAQLDLDDVIARSDVLSLHLPLTTETDGILGRQRRSLLPRGSFIINVARGQLIASGALLKRRHSGHVSGAALDVLATEPPACDRLARHPRVLVTPHVAYLSAESARDYVLSQAQNVVSIIMGTTGSSN